MENLDTYMHTYCYGIACRRKNKNAKIRKTFSIYLEKISAKIFFGIFLLALKIANFFPASSVGKSSLYQESGLHTLRCKFLARNIEVSLAQL